MALIGKIRAASGLTIIVIGGAMVAFILGDLFSNRGATNPNEQDVGSVFGNPISLMEFDARVQSDIGFIKNGQPYLEDHQVRQQVWSQMVRERIIGQEAQEAGITFTKGEFDDLRWGENLLPELKNDPSIIDSLTGQPNRERLRQFFLGVEQRDPALYEYQKRQIRNGRVQTKYNGLVKASLFVNTLEARHDFDSRNTKADLRFIARPYTGMADSLISVDDNELNTWFNANKSKEEYKQDGSRSFDYVVFNVKASEEDIATIRQELVALKDEFHETEADSLFARDQSNSEEYVVIAYQDGSLDVETDSLILAADTNDVIGPYKEGDSFKLAKVKSLEMVPELRYEQIQISAASGGTIETANTLADSLKKVIKSKRNFAAMVEEFSDDLASKSNEGVIEWIDESRMRDKTLASELFGEANKNELRVIQGDYGVYLYRILEVREREQRNLVIVDRTIRPLENTFKDVYKEANRFSSTNTEFELFHSAAEEEGLVLEEVADMPLGQRYVRDLRDPNKMISWVNKAEEGQVSEPFRTDERFVVAILKSIKEDGEPSFEDLRETAEIEVVKEKKAAAMITEMSGITDIDELATTIGETVRSANEFIFSNSAFPGGFEEPELIGLAFALQAGQTTVPLKGENGVFVIKMESLTDALELSDVSSEQRTMLEAKETASAVSVYRALERKADVQDERAKLGY